MHKPLDIEITGGSVLLKDRNNPTFSPDGVMDLKKKFGVESVVVQCRQRVPRGIDKMPWEPVRTSGEFNFDHRREYRVVVNMELSGLEIDDKHPHVIIHDSSLPRLSMHSGMYLCDGWTDMGARLDGYLDWEDVKIMFIPEFGDRHLEAMCAEMTFHPNKVTISDNWERKQGEVSI